MLYPGLYEQVINNALNRELTEIPEARKSTAPIDTAEAAKVLAQYLTDVVQKGLENVQDNGGGIEAQIQLANQIVTTIQNTTAVCSAPGGDPEAKSVHLPGGAEGCQFRRAVCGQPQSRQHRPSVCFHPDLQFSGACRQNGSGFLRLHRCGRISSCSCTHLPEAAGILPAEIPPH